MEITDMPLPLTSEEAANMTEYYGSQERKKKNRKGAKEKRTERGM
jgi:hypothetical protein